MLCLGVVGGYIGKIYSEVKRRPRFLIETHLKALCGGALEERIGLALVAHAVDDVAALHIFFDEAVDDVNVILQVGLRYYTCRCR